MKHYLQSTLTIIALLFLASGAWAQFSGSGSGYATNPYIITTATHLDQVRNNLKAHYKLGNDIDLTSYISSGNGTSDATLGWLSISDNSVGPIGYFTGSFDGDGHTISGLFINRPTTNDCGLFGFVGTGGSVKNVGVNISPVGVTGNRYVGGLSAISTGTIENCYVNGSVTGNYWVGGLVGSSSGRIENCYSAGSVTGTGPRFGGLVGENHTGATITSSFFNSEETNLPGVGINDGTGTANGKTTANMKKQATFSGWNFTTIWGIQENATYPFLRFLPTTYTVTFNSQGGSAVASQNVTSGAKATTPMPPTRSGYTFGGWYREATCINAWVFATDIVTSNMTLYAKWTANSVLHFVTIPAVTGIATSPAAGNRTIANGGDFVFELWPLVGYSISNLAISTNRGNTIATAFLSSTPGSERLQVTVRNITAATTIIITGVNPVANEPTPTATRVWGYNGMAYFSLAEQTDVSIYTFNGILYDKCTLPAGDSSIQLPAGLYIIRTSNQNLWKILIK